MVVVEGVRSCVVRSVWHLGALCVMIVCDLTVCNLCRQVLAVPHSCTSVLVTQNMTTAPSTRTCTAHTVACRHWQSPPPAVCASQNQPPSTHPKAPHALHAPSQHDATKNQHLPPKTPPHTHTHTLPPPDDGCAAQPRPLDHGDDLVVLLLQQRQLEQVLGGVHLDLAVLAVTVQRMHHAVRHLGAQGGGEGVQGLGWACLGVCAGSVEVVKTEDDKSWFGCGVVRVGGWQAHWKLAVEGLQCWHCTSYT